MDVLFFVFFQAIVRAVARDPTDSEALKPVLGLMNHTDLAPLGDLPKKKVGEWGKAKSNMLLNVLGMLLVSLCSLHFTVGLLRMLVVWFFQANGMINPMDSCSIGYTDSLLGC